MTGCPCFFLEGRPSLAAFCFGAPQRLALLVSCGAGMQGDPCVFDCPGPGKGVIW